MKTLHWNGEFWFENRDGLLKRALCWLCWLGGWSVYRDLRRDAFYRRGQSELRLFLHLITPISLFGHRLTLFGGRGRWWQLRIRGGYLVYTGKHYRGSHPSPALYHSPDGTPMQATTWFFGAPYDVCKTAAEHQRETEALKARFAREREQRIASRS